MTSCWCRIGRFRAIQCNYLFIKIIWSKINPSTKPTVFPPTFILDFKVTIVEVKGWNEWIARMDDWANSCCEEWQLGSFNVVTPASHLFHNCWRQTAVDDRNINTSFLKYFPCNKENNQSQLVVHCVNVETHGRWYGSITELLRWWTWNPGITGLKRFPLNIRATKEK